MQIKSIAVVGAGTMGNGIAQACAVAGFPVTLTDIAQAQLDRVGERARFPSISLGCRSVEVLSALEEAGCRVRFRKAQ